ncbi:MAG: hypothetical protein MAG453_00400 [Calditrichaeota bacterium]|nr:hypothetical protein [Calditrichota bacterium]
MLRYGFGFVILLVLAAPAAAQVSIGPYDIPATPGTTAEYYLETGDLENGVPVDVGSEGGNRFWDFTSGSTEIMQEEEIVEPGESPFIDVFPAANRVTLGALPFGFIEGGAWRYDRITAASWKLLGVAVEVEGIELPVPLGNGLQLMELPLDYGDDWEEAISTTVGFAADELPAPVPFDSVLFEISIGGFNEVDAWGTAAVPGGAAPVLRVHSNLGGVVEAFGVIYIFGIRIVIPLGEVFSLDATHAYAWYAPGLGEIAYIASLPGEQDPNFTEASLVRRRTLESEALVTLTATPQNEPIVIPPGGGTFSWDLALATAVPNPVNGDVWTSVTTPGGAELTLDVVPVTLPANADIDYPGVQQDVPGAAPAGTYTYTVRAGIYPALPLAQDSFEFFKELGAGAAGAGGWASRGLPGTVAAEPGRSVATPESFALGEVYPNPFNASATVTVTLPESADLTVRVFDTLGRTAATLADGSFALGEHRFALDASALAAGVYFVEAVADGHGHQVRKAVLVR